MINTKYGGATFLSLHFFQSTHKYYYLFTFKLQSARSSSEMNVYERSWVEIMFHTLRRF